MDRTGLNSPTSVYDRIAPFCDEAAKSSESREAEDPSISPPATSDALDAEEPLTMPAAISDDDDYFPDTTNDAGKIHDDYFPETSDDVEKIHELKVAQVRTRSTISTISHDTTHTERMIRAAESALEMSSVRHKRKAANAELREHSAMKATVHQLPMYGCGLMSIFGLGIKEDGEPAPFSETYVAMEQSVDKQDIDNVSCFLDNEDNISCFLQVNASESTHQMTNIKQEPSTPLPREDFMTRYNRALARAAIKNAEHQTKKAELEVYQTKLEAMRLDERMVEGDDDESWESHYEDDATSAGSTDSDDIFELVMSLFKKSHPSILGGMRPPSSLTRRSREAAASSAARSRVPSSNVNNKARRTKSRECNMVFL
mmetsp:Transcript_3638/g.9252  ORF Transcript_3638/g.9252 Transcript_3638/m.9252 type:complete len:372 (+) Transcript_3638:164-1279(+)